MWRLRDPLYLFHTTCHGLNAMSQGKNLIVLQEELTKEGRFFRTIEARK
jgi:hypothetical protein